MTSYNGASYTWMGRELRKITNGSNTYSYKYNADGIRTSKTVNGTTTELFLNGTQILAQKTGDSVMRFFYDSTGKRVGFANGTMLFYYLYNVQGDVIAIVRAATGQIVAKYSYDAWGKCTVTNATGYAVGDKNPFRYRGYYYDTETGLYYLNSRYYSPEFGRFINADSQLNLKDGIPGYNLFAYCNNNPIMYSDPSGHSFILACIIVGAVLGGLAGGYIAAKSSKAQTGKINGWTAAGGILAGGVLGGLAGWGIGAAITAIGAAATGATGTAAAPIVEQAVEKTSTALQTYYPPNNGFSGAIERISLDVGTILQRTGDLAGRFAAPAGTPSQMLALPYDKIGQATTYLQTTQPIQALSGTVAPWFGQIGGGTQYILLDGRVDQLIAGGILKILGE